MTSKQKVGVIILTVVVFLGSCYLESYYLKLNEKAENDFQLYVSGYNGQKYQTIR